MPIKYVDTEVAVLTAAQKTKFVNFLSITWPGAVGDIDRAVLTRQGSDLVFGAYGTRVTDNIGELPPPPFSVEVVGSDYVYDETIETILTPARKAAFIDFVTDTWTGDPNDVDSVTFTQVNGTSDIRATFVGTKTAATVGDLPNRKLDIVEIT